jgi:hypothetical protein
MSDWGNPLRKKQPKAEKPKAEKPEKEIQKFKKEKLTLPKTEAKKILAVSGNLSYSQIAWAQRWLDQRVRERSLPPQLAGSDAMGYLTSFLCPSDALALLDDIRRDYQKILWPDELKAPDFPLATLESEAYHEHLPPPHMSSYNNDSQDDDL